MSDIMARPMWLSQIKLPDFLTSCQFESRARQGTYITGGDVIRDEAAQLSNSQKKLTAGGSSNLLKISASPI